jgi:hypothetical protein
MNGFPWLADEAIARECQNIADERYEKLFSELTPDQQREIKGNYILDYSEKDAD